MVERRNWQEDEVREALALYLVTDFGRFHSRNPDIISMAARLGRTPSAVALKLANLAALDDSLPQRGMGNASATDRRVWETYLEKPDAVILTYERQTNSARDPALPEAALMPGIAEDATAFDHLGGMRSSQSLQRVGQHMFRRMVLTNYRGRCALTGIDDARLLSASHILPWSEVPELRMRPTNGLCLNALHDRAFDRHLISFAADGCLLLSPHLSADTRQHLERNSRGGLELPARFAPDTTFLAQHRARFETLAG